jgi:hypothetical protein
VTDRHAGYIVTLAADVREDDAEAIRNALRMVKGVLAVTPVVAGPEVHIAVDRANARWRQKLYDLASTSEETR